MLGSICDSVSIRMSDHQVSELLEKLDRQPEFACPKLARGEKRFPYRNRTVLIEIGEAENMFRCSAPTRNISGHGIGVLLGRYLYSNTKCRVRLVSDFNFTQTIPGHVVRCRYLSGTVGIHEVGIKFDQPIDVGLYFSGAVSSSVLVIESENAYRPLLEPLLERLHAHARFEADLESAGKALESEKFQVVIFGADEAPASFVRTLRESGYLRAIAGLGAMTQEELTQEFAKLGCADIEPIPVTTDGLLKLAAMLQPEPVVSIASHDPRIAQLIQAFVEVFPRRCKTIENAFAEIDADTLRQELEFIAFSANSTSLHALRVQAESALERLNADVPVRELRKDIARTIELCEAVRAVAAKTETE
ncbi:MAG: PilZ domain-containing protein [Phycisphaerae bacterium]